MALPSRRRFITNIAWMGCGVALCGCRSTPITGRKQLMLIPEDQETVMGLQAYNDIVQKEPQSTNQHFLDVVNRVGGRIAAVAGRPDYQWEFRVIASEQMNAFALPGGKVAMYEGIMPVCQNEAGVAVVMSHEVAHALARHGGERMSQTYAVDGVKQAVSYVWGNQAEEKKKLIMQAYGVASHYGVILPYSRKHESEADHMGLMLMARAGYDPAEAPRFWQRFGRVGGDKPPEFLSTHPADQRRAADLAALLPEAQQLYQQAAMKYGTGIVLNAPARRPASPAAPGASPPGGGAITAQRPELWLPGQPQSVLPSYDSRR